MNLLNAIILGIVEGITEFLPISSTAHLIITSKLLHIAQTDFIKFFEVFIQSGAILAVVFIYISYVLKHKKIVNKIIISFIPTAIIGFLFYKIIKTIFFGSSLLIVFAMILFGLIFLVIEYLIFLKKLHIEKNLQKITWKQAIVIGIGQALAVVPGVSRSGIVMLTMMGLGYKRDESAMYSFLLAVPTIVAASLLDIIKMRSMIVSLSMNDFQFLITGLVVSFITAYISMKWLISFLQKKSLVYFGIYRIVLGILLLIIGV